MERLTPDTVRKLARQLYDYTLDDEAAASIAHIVGAMAAYTGRLETLGLDGRQPPFGYPVLLAEAQALRRGGGAQ